MEQVEFLRKTYSRLAVATAGPPHEHDAAERSDDRNESRTAWPSYVECRSVYREQPQLFTCASEIAGAKSRAFHCGRAYGETRPQLPVEFQIYL